MAIIDRPRPHIPGFACPMMPGLECPEISGHVRPGSAEAKREFCKAEARRSGVVVFDPAERMGERFRK